ncbi:MAG: efflux RND transporter periplasmic adaptor subunit [Sphingomonas sp.]|uniref:efflux RND transporter periplasmic adaptor subunit n=1 Tax=Sphingomonas sp. TaxID=28214 RepID=UPI0025D3AB37|nr:efflux RND transporter periplasmic adaptor subunit [Sphingomonas sp.]MBX9883190.1 efflux RND transporter periplasmic adaptor subunit [Sphingomonas sp.]
MGHGRQLLMMGALMLAACGQRGGPPAPPPTVVTVATPLQRNVVDWDEYIGRFEAPQDVELRPRVSGAIDQVLFSDGQNVRQGQALFVIDPRPYRATLQQARAQVLRAEATLANARTELARAQTLLGAQAISREEFETREATVRTAQADLRAAQAQVTNAALNLSFTTVRAPVSGRISDRRVSRGNLVQDGQTVLTRIVSIDPIWFTFTGAENFYLKYLRQDASGQRKSSRYTPNPIEIQLADESGYRWKGRMAFVDNAIDAQSGTIRAHAVVPNPTGFLTPGLFGRARLLGSGTYHAMLVPDEAILTDQTRKLVYVLTKDNKIAPRPVVTGPPVEGLRVVKEGLGPNELVVINGITRLQPGMSVQPRRTALKPRAEDTSPVAQPIDAPLPAEAKAG